jgi:hypothetical protein
MHDHASEADEKQEMITNCRIEVYIHYLDNLCKINKGQAIDPYIYIYIIRNIYYIYNQERETHTEMGREGKWWKERHERPCDWAVICSDTGVYIQRKTEGKRKRADVEKDILSGGE